MDKKILITGGSGLVGSLLTKKLVEKGYQVSHLSRRNGQKDGINIYKWDIQNKQIDPAAFDGVTHIVHLAGAGVADERWTPQRKQIIRSSRIDSALLLFDQVRKHNLSLEGFISASAIGIYGNNDGKVVFDETSPHASDFLAQVVVDWEKAVENFNDIGIRTALLRIGVVLAKEGGALQKIAQPIRYGIGAPLASGNQYMSWIHINDLVDMFVMAIENEKISGPYDAVAPNPVTNKEFTKITAEVLKKPLWLPNVPSFVLKLMLGEMASIVTGGSRVSDKKIRETGFNPKFTEAKEAILDLLSTK